MSGSLPLLSSRLKRYDKTITFDGTAGAGAQGTVAVADIAGSILIDTLIVQCTTNLAGASATIEMGTANNTAALIAQTTATDIDQNEFWGDATPEAKVGTVVQNKAVGANIIITVGTADITAGVLKVSIFYRPLSPNGNLASPA